jgi:hypothetical protein
MFGAWGASEWFFGNQQKGWNEQLRRQFLTEYDVTTLHVQPALFHCVVRKRNGFTHCMTGIDVGDVVEVLEEGCGPDGLYNLCRLPAKPNDDRSIDTYGWFPYRWLQKYDDYESMAQQHRQPQQPPQQQQPPPPPQQQQQP